MPFVTEAQDLEEAPVMPATVAPQSTQTPESPGALDVAAAALRQNNILSSIISKAENGGFTGYPAVPGYSPFDDGGKAIAGYDPSRFVHSESPEQTQAIVNQINSERADQQTLARAGKLGFVASLAAGAVDPVNLAAMLIPGLGEEAEGGRLAMIARGAAASAVTGEAQAAGLATTQQTNDYSRGIIPRIGANALLGGVLGGIATRIPRPELDALADRTASRLEAPESSTAGAAAVPTTTLADESIAKGGQGIAKSVGQVSPVTRIFANSKVPEARQLAQQLVDVPYLLNKNLEGVATPTSAEIRINAQQSLRNAQLFQKFDQEFAGYKMEGGTLSKSDFGAAVADAMRNGDAHDIPAVRRVAQFVRPLFTGDRATLAGLGEMAPGEDVIGAPSYFPRVFDKAAVLNRQTDLEQRLNQWFTQNPKLDEKTGLPVDREPAEITASVRNTIDHILGTVSGTADFGSIKNPGVLKGRVLDVPDEILKPYLSHDFEHVVSSYNRSIVPQIEMRKTFGSVTLEKELQSVRDAYNVKQAYATLDETKAALSKQMNADMSDLTLLRDRLLNQTGPRLDQPLYFVRAAQLMRSYNYVRMLGTQTLSALPDVGRLVARYGLLNTGRRIASFIASSEARALTKADAQRMATALDEVLHTRAHSLDGAGDEFAGSELPTRIHNATARFTKLTGIASWDSIMRALSSQLEQDGLYRQVMRGNASTLERAKLAAHGIGADDLAAIRDQWAKYGSDENGLNRARTELWDDKGAAAKVEQAVQRAASSNAFFLSHGDLPKFANSQFGKLFLQFRSFSVASVNRLAIPLAQGLAHRDVMAANGLLSMLTLGAMTSVLKDLAYGRKPDFSDPGKLMADAVQRSGVLSYLPDIYNFGAGMLHLPVTQKFQDLDPLESLMGPTYGTTGALVEAISRLTSGKLTASDIHRIRQLIPYQNFWAFARIVNMLEGKADDALNVKGAPGKDALDYFNVTQDTAPKERDSKTHFMEQEWIPNQF